MDGAVAEGVGVMYAIAEDGEEVRLLVVKVDEVVVAEVDEGGVKEEGLEVVMDTEELGLEMVALVDDDEHKDGDEVLELPAPEMA